MAQQVDDAEDGYGWVEGVFVPTLLTILGVILFLRTGWVVGNAGLAGGTLVILLAYVITGATALSLASIATNTRIGDGGAFAIVTRSLGPEAGGAIGIPLYLSQTLVIALYLFGFRDGWLRIFPDHPALVVDLAGFVVLIAIALVSARFSFRIQFVILALVVGALMSMAAAVAIDGLDRTPQLWGDYPGAPDTGFAGTDFWGVFAVFFPATTGIMAGANMSGELRRSKRAIPRGTLLAVGLSLIVYLATAVWLSASVPPDRLARDYLVAVEQAAWGPAVLAGLLGATFSSALASVVGAPRILRALADQDLLPRGAWLAARARDGEPRRALAVTAVIVLAGIASRALNAIAPIITLFFLITYGTINLAVLVEQALDLPSFRPRLRLPMVVPFVGAVGSLVAMLVVNLVFTVAAIVVVIAILVLLVRRSAETPYSDVRSALFQRLSRWAADRARATRTSAQRSWRPNVLVAVHDPSQLDRVVPFLRDLTAPKGSVTLVGLGGDGVTEGLDDAGARLRDADIATTWSVVDADTAADAVATGADGDADRAASAAPNVLFVDFPASPEEADEARGAIAAADDLGLGVVLLSHVHAGRVGGRGVVNLWVRPQPEDVDVTSDEIGHSHLAILLAIKLQENWAGGTLNLLTAVADEGRRSAAHEYLHDLIDAGRLPGPPVVHVLTGPFADTLPSSPVADANVFALGPDIDFSALHERIATLDTPCVFVRDSGHEDAFI